MAHPSSPPPVRRRSRSIGLTLCLVAGLTLPGCVDSPEEDARENVRERATAIADETSTWLSAHPDRGDGQPSNEEILRHLADAAEAEVLRATVRNPDPHGTGVLASTDVVMTGTGSEWLWSQVETAYQVCVRFEVTHPGDGTRKVSVRTIDCPPEVARTPTPG